MHVRSNFGAERYFLTALSRKIPTFIFQAWKKPNLAFFRRLNSRKASESFHFYVKTGGIIMQKWHMQ
jgi:hypothetical protein